MKRIIAIFLLLSLSFCSCTHKITPLERNFFAMDTLINVRIWGDKTTLNQVCESIQKYDALLSSHDPGSDICKLNEGGHLILQDQTAELLALASQYSLETGGAFDPTVYPFIEAWRNAKDTPPELQELLSLSEQIGIKNLSLDGNSASLENQAMIDLGAIAKGYTAQKTIEELKNRNVETAIITLGGNVQTLGSKPDGSKWAVGISDPQNPNRAKAVVSFYGSMALVTSGSYQRYYEFGGERYHHILDPKTGYPAQNDLASVTILTQDGTLADAFSTALFVMGLSDACEFWRSRTDFEAVFILNNGSILATEGAIPLLSECEFTVIER